MTSGPFNEEFQVVPLYCGAPTSTGAFFSAFMDITGAKKVRFLVSYKTIDTATTLYLYCATSNASTSAIATKGTYTKATIGTDSWGDVTALASTGLSLTATTDDSTAYIVEADPVVIRNEGDDYKFVGIYSSATNYSTAMAANVWGIMVPAYAQHDMISSS